MTPRKIFLFGLCIMAALFVISAVFPVNGWKIGTQTFHFPDFRKWRQQDTAAYKDIRSIVALVDTADYEIPPVKPVATDTVAADSAVVAADTLKKAISVEDLHAGVHPFEYPEGQDTLMYPFFRTLGNINLRDKPLRILHYGDSQIEGDRITATIRNYMQKNFGGQGIGFIPIVPATDAAVTFQQELSPNWTRLSILDRNTGQVAAHNRFGISGNLARYSAADTADSIAHVGLLPWYMGYRNARSFTHARLFYGVSDTSFSIVINRNTAQRMAAGNIVSSAWWHFAEPQNSLDLQLQAPVLPDFYGIALDGAKGVAVDNLPMRGGSGLDFSRMDTAQTGQMFRMMDVEMLIMQFGANVVPHIVDNYGYYARRLAVQIRMLKALKPGLVIIVIGVNDMSQNSPDGYKSYPNIIKIRDAQKQAAFETGCAFWDLYEAMGGENSMPAWVLAEPPLAQKDFVHFTHGGARVIAELFCKAWDREYHRYSNR